MAGPSPNFIGRGPGINNIESLPLYCYLPVTLPRPSSCFFTLEINHLTLAVVRLTNNESLEAIALGKEGSRDTGEN
jgi:hypothetical protein